MIVFLDFYLKITTWETLKANFSKYLIGLRNLDPEICTGNFLSFEIILQSKNKIGKSSNKFTLPLHSNILSEIKNFFVCCGLNSIGIGSGGGVGKVTAEWLMTGHINEDIFSYDIKRFQKFHSELGFIKKRITESLGDLYGMHWPFKQHKTSRNIKTLPHHENLKSFGACFKTNAGPVAFN